MSENNSGAVVIKAGGVTLTYRNIASDIIHCSCSKDGRKQVTSPLEIQLPEQGKLDYESTQSFCLLGNGRMNVKIDIRTGAVCWTLADTGKLLFEEPGRELEEIPVFRYTVNGDNLDVSRVKTVDGERNFVNNLVSQKVRTAYRGKLYFKWQEKERIHGLGQGEEGIYNYRGTTQYLYQHNMRSPIPFLVSDQGYGILFDCGSLMTFNDDCRGSYVYFDTIDQLSYYIIQGNNLDEIMSGVRRLTGHAPMLPKWSFGYIQSKEAYHTQEELLSVASEYRKRKIPIDGIVQDWNTWEDGKWGNKILDKTRYPDFQAAVEELHRKYVHVMVSVWPNMSSDGENYEEFKKENLLLNDFCTYDAFNPEGRNMYWKQLEQELFSAGVDAWWCDSTEPFSGPDWEGSYKKEPWERYLIVGEEHKKYLDPGEANLYGAVHARGIYDNQRNSCKDKRVLNLTRSGYAGSQAYGTVLWSGDICATWETFQKQIREGLNFCMSGHPYWTLDAGGFFVVKDNWKKRGCGCHNDPEPKWFWQGGYELGIEDRAYRELYVRWMQFSVFLPMFRSHGTDTPREIWNFGEPGTMFYDALEKCIRLRYQLLPYTYSLAGKVALNDYTMFRSLMFDFPKDETACELGSQFMYGDSILICPVTEAMYYEPENCSLETKKLWDCYLPSGVSWYDFESGEKYEGGQWVTVEAILDQIPVFVREGGIIPMEQGLEYTSESVNTPFEFHIYEGKDGDFELYEDAGDGYEYESGMYNLIPVSWNDTEKELCVGESSFVFDQSLSGRICVVHTSSGKTKTFSYNGKEIKVKIQAIDS